MRPSFRTTLRNRSIENRSNDNRFRINWSHSVKLTGYVFLRSPPRPTVDFHSSSIPPFLRSPATRVPSPSTPSRPGHETRLPGLPPRSPLSPLEFSIRKPSRVTLRPSLSFPSYR